MHLVWGGVLDDVYLCEVYDKDGQGILMVKKDDVVLHSVDVTLSYGAIFGPDIGDIYEWQDLCLKYIDGVENDQSGARAD